MLSASALTRDGSFGFISCEHAFASFGSRCICREAAGVWLWDCRYLVSRCGLAGSACLWKNSHISSEALMSLVVLPNRISG